MRKMCCEAFCFAILSVLVVTAAEAYGPRYGLWEAEKLIRFHEITFIIKSFTSCDE